MRDYRIPSGSSPWGQRRFDMGLLDAGGRGDKVGKTRDWALGGGLEPTEPALLSEEGMEAVIDRIAVVSYSSNSNS